MTYITKPATCSLVSRLGPMLRYAYSRHLHPFSATKMKTYTTPIVPIHSVSI